MTAPPRPCPICGAPPEARYRPFCSRRCADIDLGRWLTGRYSIPAEEAPPVPPAPPGTEEPGR